MCGELLLVLGRQAELWWLVFVLSRHRAVFGLISSCAGFHSDSGMEWKAAMQCHTDILAS